MTDYPVLIPSLIVFIAFFVRSLSGFGSALISIPLLAFFFDLKFAIPMELIFEIVLSFLLILPVWRSADLSQLGPLIVGLLLGRVLGAHLLATSPNETLMIVLGVVVIAFSTYLIKTARKPITVSIPAKWGIPIGIIGGVFGGLLGMSGPLVVLYLACQIEEKEKLRASLIVIFLINSVWGAILYWYNGLFSQEMLSVALVLSPAFFLATFLGYKAHYQVSESWFRIIVSLVVMVSGVLLIMRGV